MRLRSILVVAALATSAVPALAQEASCPTTQVTYDLTAKLTLSDTPHGQGNGTYAIGPGRAVVRFHGRDVAMLSYSMRQSFKIKSRALFWKTTVVTQANTTATPDRCRVVARGTFDGQRIHWTTPVAGYRTEGTLDCHGSLCGRFGAPPSGQSPLRIGPEPQAFSDWVFAPGGKAFSMAKTKGPRTEMPKQSSAVTVTGTEVGRTCAPPPPACR